MGCYLFVCHFKLCHRFYILQQFLSKHHVGDRRGMYLSALKSILSKNKLELFGLVLCVPHQLHRLWFKITKYLIAAVRKLKN